MNPVSLRTRLTGLIILVQIVVLIPLGLWSYQREHREMDDLLNGRLARAGHTLAALIQNNDTATIANNRNPVMVSVHDEHFEEEGGFQVYNTAHELIIATANLQNLPPPTPQDFGFRYVTYQEHLYCIFTFLSKKGLTVRIGERTDNRQDITRGLVLEHALPLLLGLPLLALLASWAVQRGLRPLLLLTQRLAERMPGSRQPVAIGDTPPEIKPLITTLNHQLKQLEDVIEREHRFNADVAHELRTPLAATMIHLESASAASDPDDATFGLSKAQQSLARLARRIEQILDLTRLEAGAASKQRTRMDLVALATEVIEELALMIAEKDIQIGLQHNVPHIYVLGHEAALIAMFRNLIENALRHVPVGGQVEVVVRQEEPFALVDISDNGPGIPLERRHLVFDRFHREPIEQSRGYGLGLSIVQRAVELHDAEIELLDSAFGQGLQVRITLPRELPRAH